ncbi:hypothetical protein DL98DRAFT_540672 [Cadophora sp. DSE1049]|nr:hypothetical protein DL98DRAFT_540672 [Cadophora sp. DSE1049]
MQVPTSIPSAEVNEVAYYEPELEIGFVPDSPSGTRKRGSRSLYRTQFLAQAYKNAIYHCSPSDFYIRCLAHADISGALYQIGIPPPSFGKGRQPQTEIRAPSTVDLWLRSRPALHTDPWHSGRA